MVAVNRLEESPVELIRRIRTVLRSTYSNAEMVQTIRDLLHEPVRRTGGEVEKDERGWPTTFGGAVVELPDEESPYDPRD